MVFLITSQFGQQDSRVSTSSSGVPSTPPPVGSSPPPPNATSTQFEIGLGQVTFSDPRGTINHGSRPASVAVKLSLHCLHSLPFTACFRKTDQGHLADIDHDDKDQFYDAETVLDGLSPSSPSEEQEYHDAGDSVNQNGDREATVTIVDDTREFFWREHCVSQSASELLHLVEQHYPQTFRCLKVRRAKLWDIYLEAFEQIMTRFLNLVVVNLTQEAVVEHLTELEELVTYGFDMTWAIDWLHTAARLHDSESLKREVSRLEGVVERLKQELAAAETQRSEFYAKAEELARQLDQPGQGSKVSRHLGSEHFESSMKIIVFP